MNFSPLFTLLSWQTASLLRSTSIFLVMMITTSIYCIDCSHFPELFFLISVPNFHTIYLASRCFFGMRNFIRTKLRISAFKLRSYIYFRYETHVCDMISKLFIALLPSLVLKFFRTIFSWENWVLFAGHILTCRLNFKKFSMAFFCWNYIGTKTVKQLSPNC